MDIPELGDAFMNHLRESNVLQVFFRRYTLGIGERRKADPDSAWPDGGSTGFENLQGETGSVLDTASIVICSLVASGREELVD